MPARGRSSGGRRKRKRDVLKEMQDPPEVKFWKLERRAITSRREKMLAVIHRRGFLTLPQLCDALSVDATTVVFDLNYLELTGEVRRTHNGVFSNGKVPPVKSAIEPN